MASIEEGDVLHRVMLPVSRPQLCAVRHRGGGNQCVRYLDSMAASILPEVSPSLTAGVFVDRSTRRRRRGPRELE